MPDYFAYGEKEIDALKSADPKLGTAIERIGKVEREVDPDLFSAIVHHIVGQQISTKAQATIWKRMNEGLGGVNPVTIEKADLSTLQSFGITFKKAQYIKDFASSVLSGELDLKKIEAMDDEEAIKSLSSIKGIGVWTAEMILLFCLQRPNVFSYGDLAIQRGLRMLYHHRSISKEQFEKYRRKFSPYCGVASLYLWQISGGAIPELKDPAPKKKGKGK